MAGKIQLFQPFDVILDVFPSGARTCSRYSISSLYQSGNDGLGLNITVVGFNGVKNLSVFLVLAADIHTDLDVGAFDLVV